MDYKNRRVLITGGLGFIGSNLALRLLELGAQVTLVDCSVPGCGANNFNIESIRDRVRVIREDIAEAGRFQNEIRRTDIIFNIAGEISHSVSMQDPERDLRLNTVAQLKFLLTCRAARPGVRVVYASTRQVYGRALYLPVDEKHPPKPVDFNGIHKLAASQYHLLLSQFAELDAIVLRLTNVYGPRMALNLPQQGFLGTFIRLALRGEQVTVYGDGASLRDPIYIDDAVEAFLLAGATPVTKSRIYNVGGRETLSVKQIAGVVAALTGSGVIHRSFPARQVLIDIGSYTSSSEQIRTDLGWQPRFRFEDGLKQTLSYFRNHLNEYLQPPPAHLPIRETAVVAQRGSHS